MMGDEEGAKGALIFVSAFNLVFVLLYLYFAYCGNGRFSGLFTL